MPVGGLPRLQNLLTFKVRLGRRAIAAVEFALVAPVLMLLFVGTQEMLTLYRTAAKLNMVAANVAEMVSLQTTPLATAGAGQSSVSDICTGAVYSLQPLPPTGLTVDVASVTTTQTAGSYDVWEVDTSGGGCSLAGNATGIGAAAACSMAKGGMLPSLSNNGGGVHGDNAIIVRASLSYPGIVGFILGNRPNFSQIAFSRWVPASALSELTCSGAGCTTVNGQTC